MILSSRISFHDRQVSLASIERLIPYLAGRDRSLVFFVGAGASSAGHTRLPATPRLLQQLLTEALASVGLVIDSELRHTIQSVSRVIGFEITLNDLWEICGDKLYLIFKALGEAEQKAAPNSVHRFLAHWLDSGGIVLTTNYDRLIEREWRRIGGTVKVRYDEHGLFGFDQWKDDLRKGGCLFKLHGSLNSPESCMGALEHVGIRLSGYRADLLQKIVLTRPLCFVGWRGVDPDIPPLLHDLLPRRRPELPIFWIHYEGSDPGKKSLDGIFSRLSPLIRPYAMANPILTEADRAFREFMKWQGWEDSLSMESEQPDDDMHGAPLDFKEAFSGCSSSRLIRFVGIAVRRGGKHNEAKKILRKGLPFVRTPAEKAAILQEIALTIQQERGRDTSESIKLLTEARKALGNTSDSEMTTSISFGIMSMTVIRLRSHPWDILKVPYLFWRYRKDLERLQDERTFALHTALWHLYLGKVLSGLLLPLVRFKVPGIRGLIMRPYNQARLAIEMSQDIHLHSTIAVLASRSVMLARLGKCELASQDISEIDRLIKILNDEARTRHWHTQKEEIMKRCP